MGNIHDSNKTYDILAQVFIIGKVHLVGRIDSISAFLAEIRSSSCNSSPFMPVPEINQILNKYFGLMNEWFFQGASHKIIETAKGKS